MSFSDGGLMVGNVEIGGIDVGPVAPRLKYTTTDKNYVFQQKP